MARRVAATRVLWLAALRSVLVIATLVATLLGSLGLAVPAHAATGVKVAIIVGPVGEELTPVYISLAEAAADAAETRGATVARAYSPDADQKSVRKAVRDANIVIYLGHGVGSPNPYSDTPSASTTNGWGLNGPKRRGDHSDSWADGSLAYYGESWIAQHARPAPGWVMIYSNACYAPGASEGFDDPATEEIAAARVGAYSRGPLADLGASAYFATDFYEGAAHLVATLLDAPDLPYGDVFASEPRFVADGLVRLPHSTVEGAETWLHRSPYFEGKVDYWYAFAGDPTASLAQLSGTALWQPGMAFPAGGTSTVLAAPYAESPGHEGQATVVLAAELIGRLPAGTDTIEVCATRCASLPVVAELPPDDRPSAAAFDQPALAISQHAWPLVTDRPIDGQPLTVRLRLHPAPLTTPAPTPSASPPPSVLLPPPPPVALPATSAPTPSSSPTPAPTSSPSPAPTLSPAPLPSATPAPSSEPDAAPGPGSVP